MLRRSTTLVLYVFHFATIRLPIIPLHIFFNSEQTHTDKTNKHARQMKFDCGIAQLKESVRAYKKNEK